MNILIPITGFTKSGGKRVISMLSNEWIKKGHHVEIVTLNDNLPYFPLDKKVKITYLSKNGKVKKLIAAIKYMLSRFEETDVFIANYHITAYLVLLVSLFERNLSKGFYYIQAYEVDFFEGKGIRNIIKKIIAFLTYKFPLKRIVNSDLFKRYKNINAQHVVYPGLDLKKYYCKDINYFNDIIKIGCIGRIEEWKGTKDVCEAVKIVRKNGYIVDFYIAFNDMEGVEHKFVCPDGDENLASFYREMDIIVAPGHIQLGAVHYPVIETMAVGSSIVTTGYLPADDSNSYVVPVKCPSKIAEAIQSIINDKELAIKKREKAKNDIKIFAWEEVAQHFLDIIEQTQGRK